MAETPSELTRASAARLQALLDGPPSRRRLEAALRHLAKWRSALLETEVAARDGQVVQSGPFAGMAYPVRAAEGARAPRLLGCYEASLAPVIETIVARGYPLVIDVGCAEGYYAVGLARRMPATQVLAHDSDPRAQGLCRVLAAANGVGDRVQVAGRIGPDGLDRCAAQPTVVICDIEGEEEALLDPVLAPGLRAADILVEVHEGRHPGLAGRLAARFSASHRVTRIDRQLRPEALPDWTHALDDLDRLLLLWEWRAAPTPWLWIERA